VGDQAIEGQDANGHPRSAGRASAVSITALLCSAE
jgi:hypothetical protein